MGIDRQRELEHRYWRLRAETEVVRLAQSCLRAEEAWNQVVLNNIADAVLTTRPDGTIVALNRTVEGLFGWTATELVGRDVSILIVDPAQLSQGAASLDARRRDGTLFPVEVAFAPVDRQHEPLHVYTLRDITERRTAERALIEARDRAEAAAIAKAAFLANMSHELRTPLNGVIGLNALLLDTKLDNDQRQLAQSLQRSAGALLSIINDILDYSKLDAGRMLIDVTPFDLETAIEDTFTVVRAGIDRPRVELLMDFNPATPRAVVGDAPRVRQILTNLIGNAVKFTESGSVTVRVSSRPSGGIEHTFWIEVIDTGIGMTSEQISRLFRDFEQGDNSMTRKFGGTGLGLAISQRLAKLMGGELSAESTIGRGSTFTLRIRFEVPGGAERRIQPSSLDPTTDLVAPVQRQLEVLLVEDNAVNQLVARKMLEQLGCAVTVAVDGREAVERARARAWDVIFMDCQMPVLDGYAATQAIRSLDTGAYRSPIIALTAHALEGDRERCESCGMNDYLAKPISRDALRTALRVWTSTCPA